MDREILFRGKSVDGGEWVEGLLFLSYATGDYSITQCDGWYPTYNNPDEGNSTEYIKVKFDTVSQYIGKDDKNFKKLFEGDKVKVLIFPRDEYNGINIPFGMDVEEIPEPKRSIEYGVIKYRNDICSFIVMTDRYEIIEFNQIIEIEKIEG